MHGLLLAILCISDFCHSFSSLWCFGLSRLLLMFCSAKTITVGPRTGICQSPTAPASCVSDLDQPGSSWQHAFSLVHPSHTPDPIHRCCTKLLHMRVHHPLPPDSRSQHTADYQVRRVGHALPLFVVSHRLGDVLSRESRTSQTASSAGGMNPVSRGSRHAWVGVIPPLQRAPQTAHGTSQYLFTGGRGESR